MVAVMGGQVAGYRIDAFVGRGGGGVVYRATHLRLGRTAALKLLAPEFAADPEFRRRFEREALMAGRLDHPHIIPVYDAGEADGVLYLAMRFVDGPDLATVIRTSPGGLDPTRVCVIVSQVASALDAAHARGLVHCDVKPANILIDREPGGPEHAYLSDFGLTRRSEGTQSGAVTGTTSYMAPERFSGAPATPSVDVYALGCVAYACLAGSPPFDGDNEPSVIAGHLYEKPPSISGRRPGLPAGIGEVLDKALAKTPADRYSSCEAFAAALREALGGGAPSGGTASAAPIPDTVPRAAISSPSALPPTRPKRVRILASAPRSRWAAVIGVVALALVATLVALTGWPFGSRDAAVATRLTGQVATLAADPAGGVYFATLVDPRIYKLEPSGTIRVIAGTGVKGDSGDDGPADKAQLTSPEGLAVDRMGDLYVADGGSNRVRKIDSAGTITTIAGNGTHESAVDGGPAARARIWNPRDVAIDRGGNIYVAEAGGRRVRKIDPRGMISTVAGTGVSGFSGDGGLATKAQLGYPVAVTTDEVGNLYIADSINSRIRRVDPAGVITTVVGDGTQGGTDDYEGPATAAHLNLPTDLAIDRAGDLYITDSFNDRILKVTGGQVSTVAGNGVPGFSGDGGSATSAHLAHPLGAVIDQDGSIVIADAGNHRVRRVNPAGTISTISTIAGTGPDYPGDGGPATQADLRLPYLARLDPLGRLVIADTANNRIRRVDPSGVISTIAGTGAPGYSGDKGNAIDAQLNHPRSLVFDPAGNLYIADTGNHRVRKVTPDGKITTIAGTGVSSYSGDNGPAAEAELSSPAGLALSQDGGLYIADGRNDRIRRIDPAGIITTVAGNGKRGFAGDGGPAALAALTAPGQIDLDRAGNLYIADQGNHRIRRVDPAGIITAIAGNGHAGDGGPARDALLIRPWGIAADPAGNLYIAEEGNNRIRKIDPTGRITTIAGSGTAGFGGDHDPATYARLWYPVGVSVGTGGTIYIADYGNNRIRKIDPTGIITTVAGPETSDDG